MITALTSPLLGCEFIARTNQRGSKNFLRLLRFVRLIMPMSLY